MNSPKLRAVVQNGAADRYAAEMKEQGYAVNQRQYTRMKSLEGKEVIVTIDSEFYTLAGVDGGLALLGTDFVSAPQVIPEVS